MKLPRLVSIALIAAITVLLSVTGCETTQGDLQGGVATGADESAVSLSGAKSADDFLVVDCLLPGQVRKLGKKMKYLTPRRAVKIPARECEIRGGEYVALDRSDYQTALTTWLPQAQAGDLEAQIYVAEINEKGLGMEPNYAQAAKWYELAARQGSSRAQISLGYLYEKGLGVPADRKKALQWYRKAAGAQQGLSFDVDGVSAQEKKELEALRKEVQRRKKETMALRRQIDQKEQQLSRALKDIRTREQKLSSLRQEVEQGRDDYVQQSKQELPAQTDAELASLRSQLTQRESELAAREREASQLRTRLAALEQQQTTVQSDLQVANQDSKEAEELKRQLQETRRQLQHMQQQVKQSESEIAMDRADFERAKHDWEQQRSEIAQAGSEKLKQMEAALREKERQYESQRQAARKQQQHVADLANEAQDYKVQLIEINRSSTELAGPSIEIIEPQGMTTRGVRIVPTGSAPGGAQIVGKVSAPAGLFTFKVNGEDRTVDADGMFRAPMPALRATSEPVKIVAIDTQGKRAAVELTLDSRGGATSSTAQAAQQAPSVEQSVADIDFGPYYALVIGNDSYSQFPALDTAVSDARAIDRILRQRYGFHSRLLLDASRYDILSALNRYREQLTEKDNFLLYYAGHGELEKVNLRGYWLPVDAEPDSTANWVSNVAITDILNTISAKQILVIADSCYSGTLTRSAIAHLDAGMSEEARINWLKIMAKRRARTVLTSGELKPVLDAGGGSHSVFAKALLDVLQSNSDVLDGRSLYRAVSARVAYAADRYGIEQVPQYGPIQHAGHEAGDFFLVPAR